MKKTFAFGPLLEKVRLERGHRTPYAFYRGGGGQKGFGLTFRNYLNIERGQSLPEAWRVERLLLALRVPPDSAAGRTLVRAYVKDMLGSEALARAAFADFQDPTPKAFAMQAELSREALAQTRRSLDMDEFKLLATDPAALACQLLLQSCGQGYTEKELARKSGLGAAELRKALGRLKALRLAKQKGAAWVSPQTGATLAPPPLTAATASLYASYWELVRRFDRRKFHNGLFYVRTTPEKIERYIEHLREVTNMAAVFSDDKEKDGRQLYVVEAQVSELFAR